MKLVMLHRQAQSHPEHRSAGSATQESRVPFRTTCWWASPVPHSSRRLCTRCGEALSRLAELVGPDFSLLVQEEHRPPVHDLIGGPAGRIPVTTAPPDRSVPGAGR